MRRGPLSGLRRLLWPTARWEQNQRAVVWAITLNSIGFNMVAAFYLLYIQRYLGVSDPQQAALYAGLALGLSPLTTGFLGPLWGRLADRLGSRLLLLRSLAAFTVGMLLAAFVRSVPQFLVVKACEGPFAGMTPVSVAFVAHNSPRDRMAESLGMLQAVQWISAVIGPLIGGVLAQQTGLRTSFFVAAALYLIAMAVLWWGMDDRHLRVSDSGGRPTPRLLASLRLPGVLAMIFVLFGVQFVDKSFGPTLPLYVAQLGAPPQSLAFLSGVAISAGALAVSCSALLAGRLARRFDPRGLLLASAALGMIFCLPIALAHSTWQLVLARALLGLSAGGMVSVAYAFGGAIARPEQRGNVLGSISSGAMFGSAASPLLAGALAATSLRSVFVVDTLVYGACLLVLWRGTPQQGRGG